MEFTDEEMNKPVVDSDGRQIGVITEVEGNTAFVNAKSEISNSTKTKLGWGNTDKIAYPLQIDDVERITGEEIRLRAGL